MRALCCAPQLRHLDISRSCVESESASNALADALCNLRQLRTLQMHFHELDHHQVRPLAAALPGLLHLRELGLSRYHFGCLLPTLRRLPRLRMLQTSLSWKDKSAEMQAKLPRVPLVSFVPITPPSL